MKNYRDRISIFSGLFLLLVLFAAANAHAMARTPKVFPIELKVDFGPAGKPVYEEKNFQIERDTTAKEAVSQVFPILSGRGCCSLREVIAIDGVKIDPAKNRWWTCSLNGSRKFSPQKKKLKPGDRIEWKYIQDSQ